MTSIDSPCSEVFVCSFTNAWLLFRFASRLAQVLLRLQSKAKTSTSPGSSNIYTESNISKNTDEINTTTYKGTVDCLYQQFQHGGIQALFKGMNAKLLQTVLTASFTFLTYEQTLVFVGRIYEILSARPKR